MTLTPLLSASFAIQLHAAAAIAAFLVGVWQLSGPKGTGTHRALGYLWVTAMAVVAVSSFWIQDLKQWYGFSWIHLISIYVLATLPLAVMAARRGHVRRHRFHMIGMFVGALVIAGAFTLLPGRIMHQVVFGG
jgi:uncharacterized membrane protein